MKSSFFSNYLLSVENDNHPTEIQFILLFSESLEIDFQTEQQNQNLKFIFESYPTLFYNALEIDSTNQSVLLFTEKQKNHISKYRFIRLVNEARKDFEKKNSLFQLDYLLIFIPASVESIDEGCFKGCLLLSSITIPNSVTSIGSHCFRGCSSLSSITIPNSVTSIGNYCFSRCSSLSSVTIPNLVTYIGYNCFDGCPFRLKA
jgi:hypothetical protein